MDNRSMDLQVNQGVRRVLVRHWIDLGRIIIRSVQGVVSVRGAMNRIVGQPPLAPKDLQTIADELNRVQQVKRVSIELNNWACEAGSWTPVAAPTPTGGGGDSQRTYRLTQD